ncbi:MAG: hypothetical protein J6U92_07560 [Clostridia bacterium]|nr:hypothetical protein [Clostridia bacterium]
MVAVKEKDEKLVKEETEKKEELNKEQKEEVKGEQENTDKQEKTEKKEEKEVAPVLEKEKGDEKEPIVDTRFKLAGVLGKTESGLMNEFYDFQIKEFMTKVGAFNLDVSEFPTVDALNELAKIGVLEYCLTPFFYSSAKGLGKKSAGGIKYSAILDFPKGESSFVAQVKDAKFAVKSGVEKVYLTLPSLSLIVKNAGKIKAQLIKISRICKSKLGLVLISDGDENNLKKALKMIESIKVERIMLFGKDQKGADKRDLTLAKQVLSNKKVFVYTDQETADGVAEFIALKADGIYLKNPLLIGKDLKEKFAINDK